MWWIWLVLFYGVIKGVREIVKKKSMEENTVLEVLFFYTFLSFVMVIVYTIGYKLIAAPKEPQILGVTWDLMLAIAAKSFVIFIAWIMGFKALRKIPISLYGLLDLSRVIFSMLLGVVFLRETMHLGQGIGLVLVCTGLLLCRYGEAFTKQRASEKCEDSEKNSGTVGVSVYLVLMALASAFLNGVSGTMDKALLRTGRLNSSQLQFWYMLFLVLFYGIYIAVTRTGIRVRAALKNGWIWLLSFLFVVGDKALFLANLSKDSKVTVMTLLKQVCCIVTILAGKFLYKEKKIAYKLFCAAIIICGIVVAAGM